jgi:hypothetical protein
MTDELKPKSGRWRTTYALLNGSRLAKPEINRTLRLIEELDASEAAEKRLREALEKAEKFVADELEVRLNSFIPLGYGADDEGCYVTDAQEALAVIRAALTPQKEAQNG